MVPRRWFLLNRQVMGKKIIKIISGVALIPFCIGFTWQFVSMTGTLHYKPDTPYVFLGGGLVYLTIHVLFNKPILTYVIGHELTHAFFAMLFGGSVKSFHASDRGGRVTITKSNFIITLAPYFFPLYTFIALVLYWIAGVAEFHGTTLAVLVFLSGASFMFHLILTFIFLQTDQNDIREEGAVFSYPLIYLFNVAFGALLVNIYLADNMDYLVFLVGGIIKSINMFSLLLKKIYLLLSAL